MTPSSSGERVQTSSLKANLRDRLASRLSDELWRLLDEADPSPLDEQDAREIVQQAASIVCFDIGRG